MGAILVMSPELVSHVEIVSSEGNFLCSFQILWVVHGRIQKILLGGGGGGGGPDVFFLVINVFHRGHRNLPRGFVPVFSGF